MMNNKCLVIIASLFTLSGIPTIGQSGLINGGFETGDYSGWTLSGSAKWYVNYQTGQGQVVEDVPFDIFSVAPDVIRTPTVMSVKQMGVESLDPMDNYHATYYPVEGSYFLSMNGVFGTAFDYTDSDGTVYSLVGLYNFTLSQAIYLNKGDVLSGWTSILTSDYPPYNTDATWVNISGNGIEAMPIRLTCKTAYEYISYNAGEPLPWLYWSWTAPMSGTYNLSLNLINDDQENTDGIHDGIRVNAVPEPSALLLLACGLAGLVGYGRRRMKK